MGKKRMLGDMVEKVRSKNAGPFWLTIDIFCGSPEAFQAVSRRVTTRRIADMLAARPESIRRFDIGDLNVVKFSLPRPQVQGSIRDRDLHGASWAALVAELVLDDE